MCEQTFLTCQWRHKVEVNRMQLLDRVLKPKKTMLQAHKQVRNCFRTCSLALSFTNLRIWKGLIRTPQTTPMYGPDYSWLYCSWWPAVVFPHWNTIITWSVVIFIAFCILSCPLQCTVVRVPWSCWSSCMYTFVEWVDCYELCPEAQSACCH